MRPGKDLDILIATHVLGHKVNKQGVKYMETTESGKRPLRAYSKDIGDAWEVVTLLGMTLIPIEGGSWFALVGPREGWKNPAEFFQCLQSADFMRAGAAITESAPFSICIAALNAVEKRKNNEQISAQPESQTIN